MLTFCEIILNAAVRVKRQSLFIQKNELVEFQFWQTIHDFDSLDADVDDTQQEVEYIAGLVVFAGPVVGIVLDERFLVLGDGVTLHNPFDGRFAIDVILVGLLRDVLNGDVAIINDGALIVLTLKAHLIYHAEIFV